MWRGETCATKIKQHKMTTNQSIIEEFNNLPSHILMVESTPHNITIEELPTGELCLTAMDGNVPIHMVIDEGGLDEALNDLWLVMYEATTSWELDQFDSFDN